MNMIDIYFMLLHISLPFLSARFTVHALADRVDDKMVRGILM